MNVIKYSFDNVIEDESQVLVEGLVSLTKMALNKKAKDNKLAKMYSISDENYDELNKSTKEACLTYSAKQAGIDTVVDVMTRKGLSRALQNDSFEWNFFSIQTATLGVLLADTEVRAMEGFVQLHTVGLGDSLTLDIGTKALYDVEEASYGNNVTRPRKHFKQPVTITPTPKEASVQFDVVQMLTNNYDFGAEMAKIVLSIRSKQYQDSVELLFTGTPLVGTPFYEPSFNLANYTNLAELVSAVNNTTATAYGTRSAYRTASANVTTGSATLDEINKTGFITDLWGVNSRIIEQSVDSSTPAFAFRVPADKLLIIGNSVGAPVQLVQEDYVSVIMEDGAKKNIMTKVYKYIYSYTVAAVSGNPYGIIEV